MTTFEVILWTAVMVAGLAGSSLCSGLETGIYTIDRIRLRVRAGRGDAGAARLSAELARTEDVLATLLIGSTVFGYFGATGIAELLHAGGYSDPEIIAIDALLFTPVLLILCEALPKELFRRGADTMTTRVAGPLRALRVAFTIVPLVPIVRGFTHLAARLLRGERAEALSLTGGQRIVAMLQDSASAGVVSATHARLVDRALALHRARVADEMVPWASVRTVQADWDRARLLRFLARESPSRFPVLDARGRTLGVLRAVDVYLRPTASIADLTLRPARLSPATPALTALATVRESPAAIGIIERDGRLVGLVTEKDLVAPLIGDPD